MGIESLTRNVDEEPSEITHPLLDNDQNPPSKSFDGKGRLFMVYFTTAVSVCGSFAFGSCAGYSSPAQAAIREDLGISISQYSLFGSILTFGAMIGAITSGKIADIVGRKNAMRVAAGFSIAGWLCIYFAMGILLLDLGRLSTGYGMGVFSYVVPIFIAEISPKDLRGALTTLNQVMICAGVSVSFIIGTVITWRCLALIGLIPCFALAVGSFFIPESPRWLAKNGHEQESKTALGRLRGPDADISNEISEIQDYIEELKKLPKARLMDLFHGRYLPSVIIGIGLMVSQQLGGINGICFYSSSIFELAGFSTSKGEITYACLQVVVTALGTFVIDRTGRKPLLLVSAGGLIAGCLLTAVAFYMEDNGLHLNLVPTLVLVGILVYIGSFSAGMGAVPWVLMSEIFPINVKGTAGSLATLVNWFCAWAVSYTYNFLVTWSSYGTFLVYAGMNAMAIVFVVTVVPETKGRSLEQIQATINK